MAAKNDQMMEEVETRLDEIFGDVELPKKTEEKESPKKKSKPVDAPEMSDPGDLKELVLSIDWEITDDVMGRFVEEVARQREVHQNDRVLVVFFKMLDSLGKYIWKYKGEANPGAVKVLNSVYSGLEQIITSTKMKDEQKEKILATELKGFKKLKKDILKKKPLGKGKKPPKKVWKSTGQKRKSDQAVEKTLKSVQEGFTKLQEDLKAFVHAEVEGLKAEMIRLLEEK